jgi:YYY domain-containing protein
MTMNDQKTKAPKPNRRWLYDLLLVLVLLAAAAFRLYGVEWDDGQNLHPDERFLTSVLTALQPVDSLREYWDSANSTLNPNNQGYGYFVYGTLPLFLIRYVAEWFGQTGWGEIQVVGRQLSALADLGVVLLVYLTASRAYNKKVGIIAAAFSAFTVLQIQLSHFLAVDTFLTMFTMLAIYFAVCLAYEQPDTDGPVFKPKYFILFGVALGMAVASKVNTVPVSITLVLAALVRFSKLDRETRYQEAAPAFAYLVLAALVSLVTFRIFQPYAFEGPGFFGVALNQDWLNTLRSLFDQQVGGVDWPPSIQWARRPVWFSAQNMVLWGMGIPMSVMAWGGFLGAAWQSLKGRWSTHLVIFGWTLAYFTWQSMAFNPTMRYQIPVYPTLTIFAGWGVVALWQAAKNKAEAARRHQWLKPAAGFIGGLVLVLTAAWAVAFSQIYSRPVTRVAASDWIYQNLPGPLTLPIETAEGAYHQPIPFSYGFRVTPGSFYLTNFQPKQAGLLSEVLVHDVRISSEHRRISLWIGEQGEFSAAQVSIDKQVEFTSGQQSTTLTFDPDDPLVLVPDTEYVFRVRLTGGQGEAILEDGYIRLMTGLGEMIVELEQLPVKLTEPLYMYEFTYQPDDIVSVSEVLISVTPLVKERPDQQLLKLTLSSEMEFSDPLAESELLVDLEDGLFRDGDFKLSEQVALDPETRYYLKLENLTDDGAVTLWGTALAVEGPWDDGLPMRTSGYDGYTGIYQPDMNFDMNADDNPDKLERFLDLLNTSEYYAISSSRQWASTTRIPERFPLNVAFYRNIMGCPEDHTIEWCYNVAEPGMFEGNLGFELLQVFTSNPNLGDWEINDQFAEEAFTVYDHPKVFIFKKTAEYSQAQATNILAAVDFDEVIRLTPTEADDFKSLMLTEEQQSRQESGGTWSELFNTDAWYNRSGFGAAVVWYVGLTLLGWAVFPLVRKALPGLSDSGFPLVRTAAMLLLAFLSWLAGSAGLGFTRPVILGVYLILIGLGLWQAYEQREWLEEELRLRWKQYLIAEAVFLGAFILVLLVRLGNPDLWHPFKGGEKPMDFAYFNAILKSEFFPAYDPWYAGGYINYYYFGFVFVGTLVKLLGIVPGFAYNLVLPTVFAMYFSGVYSAAGNLFSHWRRDRAAEDRLMPWMAGLIAAVTAGLLGNLMTVKMLFSMFFDGAGYGTANWYWDPSRAIPGLGDVEPITEFPWFTTIYADLHAHFMALPLTVLALGWVLSVVLSKAWRGASRGQVLWSFVFAGVVIGALRPTNTWDLPTYLALGVVALIFSIWRFWEPAEDGLLASLDRNAAKVIVILGAAALLVLMTFILYQPYAASYLQPYGKIRVWDGPHTPLNAYLWHWGLFLFVLVFWMGWETRQWMANTPLSHLRKLERAKTALLVLLAGFVLLLIGLFFVYDVKIHFIALPLALWAAVLLLRSNISNAKRAVLFLVGTAFFLTVFVEVVVLAGDIGRMNTVFKFYLQAWTLFSVSSTLAVGWTIGDLRLWNWGWKSAWLFGLALLVFSAALYPYSATGSKIVDRMSADAPITLDGMAYMQYAEYPDEGGTVVLAEDYRAIRWMQENVQGTPVIVEANAPIYRWGSRYSIYTGLSAVIGWDWHQTQQRGASRTSDIEGRKAAVTEFYTTEDRATVLRFLWEYDVKYVIVGQVERNYYPGPGLEKFEALNGDVWQEVYRDGSTVIYQVIEN